MPLRFSFRQLEYLVAVGEAGTIALAAQRVNVSSPSISSAISQLEADLGLQLQRLALDHLNLSNRYCQTPYLPCPLAALE